MSRHNWYQCWSLWNMYWLNTKQYWMSKCHKKNHCYIDGLLVVVKVNASREEMKIRGRKKRKWLKSNYFLYNQFQCMLTMENQLKKLMALLKNIEELWWFKNWGGRSWISPNKRPKFKRSWKKFIVDILIKKIPKT